MDRERKMAADALLVDLAHRFWTSVNASAIQGLGDIRAVDVKAFQDWLAWWQAENVACAGPRAAAPLQHHQV